MFEQFSTKQVAISFWFADWLRESREFSRPITECRKKTNPILRSRHKKKLTEARETPLTKTRLVSVLHLIGWESGTSFLRPTTEIALIYWNREKRLDVKISHFYLRRDSFSQDWVRWKAGVNTYLVDSGNTSCECCFGLVGKVCCTRSFHWSGCCCCYFSVFRHRNIKN